MDKKTFKIALTGGPCSGKTTSLSNIVQRFSADFKVLTVPEMGTIAFHSGVVLDPQTYSEDEHKLFTQKICQVQMDLESFYEDVAGMQKRPTLIVCDRGVVDNFAYTSKANKLRILEDTNWSYNYICNQRYDLVVHLVTAAIGAEDYYTKANNEARSESVEQARALDKRIRKEWMGHPNFCIVDNSLPGFEKKIERVIAAISSLIGVHRPKFSRRFLIQSPFDIKGIPEEIKMKVYYEDIQLLFSNKENSVTFIKKRHFPNSISIFFVITRKFSEKIEEQVETVKTISERAYLDYHNHIDPAHFPMKKTIISFSLETKDQVRVYNIEQISVDGKIIDILKAFIDVEGQEPMIPAFIKTSAEITNDPIYRLDEVTKKPI